MRERGETVGGEKEEAGRAVNWRLFSFVSLSLSLLLPLTVAGAEPVCCWPPLPGLPDLTGEATRRETPVLVVCVLKWCVSKSGGML